MALKRKHIIRMIMNISLGYDKSNLRRFSKKQLVEILSDAAEFEISNEVQNTRDCRECIVDLEKTVEGFRTRNDHQVTLIQTLRDQIADLQTENNSLRIQAREHSASAERLAADLLNCSVDASKTINRLKQDNTTLTEQNAHLRSEYSRIYDRLLAHIANPGSFL